MWLCRYKFECRCNHFYARLKLFKIEKGCITIVYLLVEMRVRVELKSFVIIVKWLIALN